MLLHQGVRKTIYITQLLDQKINGIFKVNLATVVMEGSVRRVMEVANFNNQLYIFSSVPTEE